MFGVPPEVPSFAEYRIYHNFPIPGKFWVSQPFDGDNHMTLRTVASRYEISSFRISRYYTPEHKRAFSNFPGNTNVIKSIFIFNCDTLIN